MLKVRATKNETDEVCVLWKWLWTCIECGLALVNLSRVDGVHRTRTPYWLKTRLVFYDECKNEPRRMCFVDSQTNRYLWLIGRQRTTPIFQLFGVASRFLAKLPNFEAIRTMCIHMLPLIVSKNGGVGGATEGHIRRSNEWLCVEYQIMYHIELFTLQPNICRTYIPRISPPPPPAQPSSLYDTRANTFLLFAQP